LEVRVHRPRIIAAITLAFALVSAALSHAQEGPPAPAGAGSYASHLPLIIGATPVPTATPQPLVSAEVQSILERTNAERAAAGCPALTLDSRLSQAAQLHALDMLQNDFFSHTSSDGATVGTRVTRQGYTWRRVAENIAAGYSTASSTMDGWMGSSGHRANILNCAYTQLGVGYLYSPTDAGSEEWYHYWVQVFATPR
jgi:uncharacterized protein YkwD